MLMFTAKCYSPGPPVHITSVKKFLSDLACYFARALCHSLSSHSLMECVNNTLGLMNVLTNGSVKCPDDMLISGTKAAPSMMACFAGS